MDKSRREALVQHLDKLYTFAQVVSPDTAQATRLVEATYKRAFALSVDQQRIPDDRAWLLRLMWEIFEEQPHTPALIDPASPPRSTPPVLEAFHRKLTIRLLDRVLLTAFANLPQADQLILILCEVENLSCHDAARVLHIEGDHACTRLDAAREDLHYMLRTNLTKAERRLLDTHLPDAWIGPALRRTLHAGLAHAPESLPDSLALLESSPVPAAHHQPADHPPARKKQRPRWQRAAIAGVLIIVTGLIGFLSMPDPPEAPATVNLITLSANQAARITPTFITNSPQSAATHVRETTGQRLQVPAIRAATLQGVHLTPVAPEVLVPTFFYTDDTSGETITLYAYTYALLHQHPDQIQLAPDIQRHIENEAHFDLHDLGLTKVLLWRDLDEIFVAVIQGDAQALRGRIEPDDPDTG